MILRFCYLLHDLQYLICSFLLSFRSVVSLLSVPVDPDTLHASLRLMLRLTREHKHAVHFAELGGPKILLNLTQASAFQGFVSLATLLFRHILEEPSSLKYCMEKVWFHYGMIYSFDNISNSVCFSLMTNSDKQKTEFPVSD